MVNIIVIALLTEGGYAGNSPKAFVAFGTPYAFIIVNLILIAALLLEEVYSKRLVRHKLVLNLDFEWLKLTIDCRIVFKDPR